MTVEIRNETSTKSCERFYDTIKKVAKKVLETEGFPFEAEISVLLTDNHGIQKINNEFRNINRPTDVLSFPAVEFDRPGCFDSLKNKTDIFNPQTKEIILGDIVISVEKALEQAVAFDNTETREVAFLTAHSMYHLLGYDHVGSASEAEIMEEKQEKVLSELCIRRGRDIDSEVRNRFKDKKRIVIKIGSSSLSHKDSGKLNLIKLEQLVRELSDLRNRGKEIALVSSGAIMVGANTLGFREKPTAISEKQACASVGQARLMMIYQKLFSEYNQICSQILITKNTMKDNLNRYNAINTFNELLSLGVIPIVNENDTIATYEIDNLSVFGDNDTLSAVVAALIHADLLILFSDIDGLYTDNPNENPQAEFVELVENISDTFIKMGKKTTSSGFGTGGMATKLSAAKIATASGCDMVIANGDDFRKIHEIISGEHLGTVFTADKQDDDYVLDLIEDL